jgi:hypothetical protein
LEDDTIKDVVVTEMNDEQGPLMHMPLTSDPEKYTNYATGLYYEKDSVVAVPRDEWNSNYKNDYARSDDVKKELEDDRKTD